MYEGVVEPSDQFVAKHGVLVAKSLIDPKNTIVPIE